MEDGDEFQSSVADAIGSDVGCAGDHEFAGTGEAARAADGWFACEEFHGFEDLRGGALGVARAVAGDEGAQGG